MQPTPVPCLILAVVSDGGVPDEALVAVRTAMTATGLSEWSSAEAGDGLVLWTSNPPHAYISASAFAGHLLTELSAGRRWRIRVGAHLAGLDRTVAVLDDPAVRVALLLADAQPVRRALDDTGGRLAVALSDEVVGTRPDGPWSLEPLRGPFEVPGEAIVGWVATVVPWRRALGGLGGPAGAGVRGAGMGAGRGGAGGLGGHETPTDSDERTTWLTDDDDPWGADDGMRQSPPPGPDFPTDR